jgi:hypothetical protein
MVLSIFGVVFAVAIALLARQRLLSLRYTLGWFLVAVSIAASGLLSGVFDSIADDLGVEPIELILGVSLVFMLLIAVQLSITASGHAEMLRTVSEALALADERLRRLEAANPGSESAGAGASRVPRGRSAPS